MREQVVGEQNGLGVLQMGASRHDRGGVFLGLRGYGVDEVDHEIADHRGMVEEVHPHEGGDLVVATAAGAQAAPEIGAHDREQRGLERTVHVFVGGLGDELTRLDPTQQFVEAHVHRGLLLLIEVAGAREGFWRARETRRCRRARAASRSASSDSGPRARARVRLRTSRPRGLRLLCLPSTYSPGATP